MFRALKGSDLTYPILSDMVKVAHLTGKVEIILRDGTTVNIIDTTVETRKSLNTADDALQEALF